eukprot:GGOE01001463.1.p4 GENE.GGOE01001463.1~~GGOE01001463.1.p4  ORF type:complete len:118 (+),score=7.95 GGOE01001463.1:755-1108(+)
MTTSFANPAGGCAGVTAKQRRLTLSLTPMHTRASRVQRDWHPAFAIRTHIAVPSFSLHLPRQPQVVLPTLRIVVWNTECFCSPLTTVVCHPLRLLCVLCQCKGDISLTHTQSRRVTI